MGPYSLTVLVILVGRFPSGMSCVEVSDQYGSVGYFRQCCQVLVRENIRWSVVGRDQMRAVRQSYLYCLEGSI